MICNIHPGMGLTLSASKELACGLGTWIAKAVLGGGISFRAPLISDDMEIVELISIITKSGILE